MYLDLDLYRREVRVSSDPLVRLSAIDFAPEHPRRTFVFIHGFGGQAAQWEFQLQHLLIENRVIALDLRGHGLSDRPDSGYDMPRIRSDLETALDLLGVRGQFVLVAHSFGGAVATDYAAAHPERVERLALIATPGQFKLSPLYAIALHLPNWLLAPASYFPGRRLGAPPSVLKSFYRQNLQTWVGWDEFKRLRVPTLVIRGHRDQVFERTYFENVTRSIPGAQEFDIGGSGHMVMLERREAVNRALDRFTAGEEQQSWREQPSSATASRRAASRRDARQVLRDERPWLAHYEPGVPYTTAVPGIPLHHLLRSAVRRFPRNPAILFEGSRITYRELNHQTNRFANALRGLGVGQGTRVVLLLPNIPQMVIGFYGTLKAGAAAVLIPPVIEPEEIIRQVQESEPSVLVTLTAWAGLAQQIRQSTRVPHVVLTHPADYLSLLVRMARGALKRRTSMPGMFYWRALLSRESERSPDVPVAPGDLAVIQYTGGTTGPARGVMLSHRNLVANAMQTRHWMPKAVEGGERFLSVVPIFHSYGMTTAMNVPIALGAAIILKARFQALDVLKAVKRYHPTMFSGVPNMYLTLGNYPGVRKYGIASIKTCISGSAPLPVEVQESFEKLTKGHLVEGYGLTEASPVTHANPFGDGGRAGSIGLPLPSTEAAIFDLRRRKSLVKPGHIGELAIRGPQVMLGYWRDPVATDAVLREDGWLLTGDVAQQDGDGFFRIISRKADMWYPDKPGRPAFPRDIEEVIYEIPQVKEVAVVGIARRPFAFVIPRGERPSADSIIAYCRRRLPPQLVPRFVVFMDDFPRTFIGKVLRRELARRYEQHGKNG
ncbi:MAG TPA: alpha/beta fold hydrolase [Anaerolineales bacterium]|nr:alpha/beta fold hydrolase [Anaerolineales bacterium]